MKATFYIYPAGRMFICDDTWGYKFAFRTEAEAASFAIRFAQDMDVGYTLNYCKP